MPDITLNIGGDVAPVSGTVELNIDWAALGTAFAETTSDNQADFLEAVQEGFGNFESIAAELTQMALVAASVPPSSRSALHRWLTRMAEALDSPGELVVAADEVTRFVTIGDIAEVLANMKADGMTLESVRYAVGQVYWPEIEASHG